MFINSPFVFLRDQHIYSTTSYLALGCRAHTLSCIIRELFIYKTDVFHKDTNKLLVDKISAFKSFCFTFEDPSVIWR
jgi:hypothetical protein